MKTFQSDKIRNLALIGHSGEGKTSLAEAMLFSAKVIDRLGRVDDGTSTMDYDTEEINRKISISLALSYAIWKDYKFNLIDVPGFFDFEGEMIAALSVSDGAVVVTSASGQLSVGTEKALEMVKEKNVPAIIFINGTDKENSNFFNTVDAIRNKYPSALPLFIPIIEDYSFKGYIDVPEGKAFNLKGNEIAIPASLNEIYETNKNLMLELVAETDDRLLEKFFSGEKFTHDELIDGIKKAMVSDKLIFALGGSALKNEGVDVLMNAVLKYIPSPNESKPKTMVDSDGNKTEIICDVNKPFTAQIFKTIADPFFGKLLLFKVMSGKLSGGDSVYNPNSDKIEKIGTVYSLIGKKQEQFSGEIQAGDIGALAKLLYSATGDTLCDQSIKNAFLPIDFPEPCIALAISALKKGDDEKVIAGVNKLLDEDSTFKLNKNIETNEMLLSGMGETQLDIICKKLKNKYNVEAKLSDPKVAYRETIKDKVEQQGKYKKQSGGHGQYGDCHIRFEPNDKPEFEFLDEVVGGAVPKNYIPAVEKGLRECLTHGVLAGYPVVNLKAALYFGSYHPVDSSEMAFKVAASMAFKEGLAKARPVLLEPIYKVTVTVPESYMGDILGDLNKRRGKILGMEGVSNKQVITAEVPYSEMFKYATDLRSITQGRGKFKMNYLRYDEVPQSAAQKIIEDYNKSNTENAG